MLMIFGMLTFVTTTGTLALSHYDGHLCHSAAVRIHLSHHDGHGGDGTLCESKTARWVLYVVRSSVGELCR